MKKEIRPLSPRGPSFTPKGPQGPNTKGLSMEHYVWEALGEKGPKEEMSQLSQEEIYQSAFSGPIPEPPTTSLTKPASKRQMRSDAKLAVQEIFTWGIEAGVKDALQKATDDYKHEVEEYTQRLKDEIQQYIQDHKRIEIITDRGVRQLDTHTHKLFADTLKLSTTGFPLMLVGPAGSGKTFAASQVAEALSLPFYATSVSSQTSKLDLVGYMNANGSYVVSPFRKAYEEGGIFLMDEIDAGNPNVLVVLNNALSGHVCSFPDTMVERHKDFIFMSTANTYGNGASRQYVGRNQIDAATLDRFITIDWPIDTELEAAMVKEYPDGKQWHKVVKHIRTFCEERGYRVIVSPRATLKGAIMLQKGFPVERIAEMTILPTASQEQRDPILNEVLRVW